MDKAKIYGKTKTFKGALKVYRRITKKDSKVYKLDRQVYWDIIKDYHKEIRELLLDKGHDYSMPKGLGNIVIRKFKSKLDPSKTLDYNVWAEKKIAEPVGIEFYENFQGRWYWRKKRRFVSNTGMYKFRVCITNKRCLSKELKKDRGHKKYSRA